MIELTYTLDEIEKVGQRLLAEAKSKIICFHGEMGTGKTTLIKAMVKTLGITDVANSPTFGIVNEYYNQEDELIAYHFDFYRLDNEIEALDFGFEDYLNQNVWVFIEWPNKVKSFLPSEKIDVYLKVLKENTRKIMIIP